MERTGTNMNIQGSLAFPFRPVTGTPATRPASAAAPARASAGAEAAEAPESSLWDLLTTEERDFFTQQAALGSITYRPNRVTAASATAPTGQRLDVRG